MKKSEELLIGGDEIKIKMEVERGFVKKIKKNGVEINIKKKF